VREVLVDHEGTPKLVPGVDLAPFWTMAVANVYRKSKRIAVTAQKNLEQHPALRDLQRS
jgi:hypothetical protein